MADNLRITASELNERLETGEHFTIIDVRNPQAWGQATDMARGAIRFHGDDVSEVLARIPPREPVVAYCT
jgi:rhodanese-related sulfurtransferase